MAPCPILRTRCLFGVQNLSHPCFFWLSTENRPVLTCNRVQPRDASFLLETQVGQPNNLLGDATQDVIDSQEIRQNFRVVSVHFPYLLDPGQ